MAPPPTPGSSTAQDASTQQTHYASDFREVCTQSDPEILRQPTRGRQREQTMRQKVGLPEADIHDVEAEAGGYPTRTDFTLEAPRWVTNRCPALPDKWRYFVCKESETVDSTRHSEVPGRSCVVRRRTMVVEPVADEADRDRLRQQREALEFRASQLQRYGQIVADQLRLEAHEEELRRIEQEERLRHDEKREEPSNDKKQ